MLLNSNGAGLGPYGLSTAAHTVSLTFSPTSKSKSHQYTLPVSSAVADARLMGTDPVGVGLVLRTVRPRGTKVYTRTLSKAYTPLARLLLSSVVVSVSFCPGRTVPEFFLTPRPLTVKVLSSGG